MNYSEYIVSLWLIPVVFQILLPLVVLCAWMVRKIPSLLFGVKTSTMNTEPSFAR